MIGCRLADAPNIWINLKAANTNALVVNSIQDGRKMEWPELWQNTTLIYEVNPHRLVKTLRLEAPGHPFVFHFTPKTAPGTSLIFEDNNATILDATGRERMRLLAPWGRDSNGKPIRVTLRDKNGTVELEVNEEDLEDAVYPVIVDPTVEIVGTTDIEDTSLVATGVGNYGGAVDLYLMAVGATYRSLIRISASSIPDGIITGFRLKVFSGAGFETHAFFIADANDWVEGTNTGGQQEGSCCWDHCKFHQVDPDQDWAGSAGCNTSGTDYDADASPPSCTLAAGWNTFTLNPEWPPLWRDAVRAPNGMIFIPQTGGYFGWNSTENGSDPLYFEIDYTPPVDDVSVLGHEFTVPLDGVDTLGHEFAVSLETTNILGHQFTVPSKPKLLADLPKSMRKRLSPIRPGW
jgi:hypothetical protein